LPRYFVLGSNERFKDRVAVIDHESTNLTFVTADLESYENEFRIFETIFEIKCSKL
jgi:hypothetical protein